jgi:hypothetical protein
VQQLVFPQQKEKEKKTHEQMTICGSYFNAGNLEEFWEFSTLCTARQLQYKG